jgi:TolB-like protein/DNA-binding winged helix-turn-helix (wHTH) protein/Flp pilus assembly protein TadD
MSSEKARKPVEVFSKPRPRVAWRFGPFHVEPNEGRLTADGEPVTLTPKAFEALVFLLERRGHLVTRDELISRLWPETFVDEANLTSTIWMIRRALGGEETWIETVPKRGYRFVGSVEDASAGFDTPPRGPEASAQQAPAAAAPRPARAEAWSWILIASTLSLAAAGGAWSVWRRQKTPVAPDNQTLAVLPFENLSGDPDRDYLADGLAEEAIASLGQIDPEHLGVIGRTSTMRYKRTTKSLAEIGRELGADYLVEGSIQAENNRLRVTSKLIRVRDQVQVWSSSYDREPTSMLGLQRELSTTIAEQIRVRLSPERLEALARRQTGRADAYDLYLRGRHLLDQSTPPTTRRAIEYFARAVEQDPGYALAWSGLARAYAGNPVHGDARPLDGWPRAREAAARALRADPNLAEAQTASGTVSFWLEWDWPAAEAAFRRATALDPNYPLAHRMLGHILSQMDRQAEARAAMGRLREVDPLFAMSHAVSSQVAFQARDYPSALEHARQAIVLDPEFWIGYVQRGQACQQLGRIDPALEAFTAAARFSGGNSKALAFRGHALARAGRLDEAREVLKTLSAVSRQRYVPPYGIALVHAGLGESAEAFEWLDRAYGARDVHLVFLTVDPRWDPYRADPRFQALLARCDFMRIANRGAAAP